VRTTRLSIKGIQLACADVGVEFFVPDLGVSKGHRPLSTRKLDRYPSRRLAINLSVAFFMAANKAAVVSASLNAGDRSLSGEYTLRTACVLPSTAEPAT
jgi:hypothetical protein